MGRERLAGRSLHARASSQPCSRTAAASLSIRPRCARVSLPASWSWRLAWTVVRRSSTSWIGIFVAAQSAAGEGLYLRGGVAERAVHVAREAEQDALGLFLLRERGEFARQLGVTLGGNKRQRPRERAGRVAQRESDARAAVVDREDAHGRVSLVAGAVPAPVGCGRVFYPDRRSESAGYL